MYISGHQDFNLFVWHFDGHSQIWSQRPVVGNAAPIITGDESSMYFVLFDKAAQLSTSCECCRSVVGFSMAMSVVWKLSCSDVESQRQFVWKTNKAGFNRSQVHLSNSGNLYPRNVAYFTAKAATEEGVIFLIAEGGLWKYDLYLNQWHNVDSFDPRDLLSGRLRAFFSSNERIYILFSLEESNLIFYSLAKQTWDIKSTVFSPKRNQWETNSALSTLTTKTSRRLLYTGGSGKCKPLLWELEGGLESTWKWTTIDRLTISPLSISGHGENVVAVSQICVGDVLYVLVEMFHPSSLWKELQLWELQLKRMAWALLKVFGKDESKRYVRVRRTAVFYESVVALFSGSSSSTGIYVMTYNTKNTLWNLDNEVLIENMLGRTGFCVAPLNSSALLLYGGQSGNWYFCDLWMVMLQSPNSSHLQWFQLQPDCEDHNNSSRDSHPLCVAVNNTLVVFGEVDFENAWHFSLIDYSWEHVFVHDNISYYGQDLSLITSAVPMGPQVVVTILNLFDTPESSMARYELWFYVVRTRTWIFHSDMVSLEFLFTFVWKNQIIFASEDLTGLSYKTLACPRGHSSPNISRDLCAPCPRGSFAHGEGETTCISCPAGLMTDSIGSSSLSNCSLCNENFCIYGVCLVLHENGLPRPFCQCRLGFSGTHCTSPKIILITLGITVAVVVIGFGLVYVVRLLRKRKRRERKLLHHVEELTTVWQIGSEEITKLERIGAGGYGEVYRARYRDMFVAMKVLPMPTIDSMMWLFEREIKFMQTVRHPNILLFLGAGRTTDGSPFIISEFVSRGSLRDLLDDNSQVLSTERKIKFCLDVAHGMKFLHSLTPPRVHRDLKSNNLLISETDVVKIADFGLGNQIPVVTSDDSSQGRRGRGSVLTRRRSCNQMSDLRLPLLDLRGQDSPHALGPARWRAPELSVLYSQSQYTTAADVYRYVYCVHILVCVRVRVRVPTIAIKRIATN